MNVAGEPAPEKRWLSNGKEMVPSDRIKIVYTSNNTKIYIRYPITSVTRLGDLLHFGQLFKACGNNYFAQIVHIFKDFL